MEEIRKALGKEGVLEDRLSIARLIAEMSKKVARSNMCGFNASVVAQNCAENSLDFYVEEKHGELFEYLLFFVQNSVRFSKENSGKTPSLGLPFFENTIAESLRAGESVESVSSRLELKKEHLDVVARIIEEKYGVSTKL